MQPRLIPVLDVMGGQVVRAVGGRRENYRPIQSQLTDSTCPVQVAAELLRLTGADQLYVADLDAIRDRSGISPKVARLFQELPTACWVDVGVSAWQEAMLLPKLPNVWPVVGLETATEPRYLTETVAAWQQPVAFSLDLMNGRLLGKWQAWAAAHDCDALGVVRVAVDCGVRTIIVLDLARVGIGTGCGTEELIVAIRTEFPELELIAGGGVKTWDDVNRLGQAGVDAVLVASALHDRSLTFPRPT